MTGKPKDIVVTDAMVNAAYEAAMKMVNDGGYGWEVSLIPDVEGKLKAALAQGYRVMAALDPARQPVAVKAANPLPLKLQADDSGDEPDGEKD